MGRRGFRRKRRRRGKSEPETDNTHDFDLRFRRERKNISTGWKISASAFRTRSVGGTSGSHLRACHHFYEGGGGGNSFAGVGLVSESGVRPGKKTSIGYGSRSEERADGGGVCRSTSGDDTTDAPAADWDDGWNLCQSVTFVWSFRWIALNLDDRSA